MKALPIILILVCIFNNESYSQKKISKWYNTSSFVDFQGNECLYSSEAADSTLTSRYQLQLDHIKNVRLSSFDYLANNDSNRTYIKDGIIGARGTLNSNEVLIIDSDMDRSLADEVIIQLPKLERDSSIIYSEEFVYPTDFNQNFQITYEKVIDNLIHQINTNLGFTVDHKYNLKDNKLEYRDRFKICFNQKLTYRGLINSTRAEISCYDYLPWVDIMGFDIRTKDFPYQYIGIKTPFRLKEEGQLFTIDSVDFINNKFLISEFGETEKFYFTGESLFSNEIVSTDSTTNNIKLVHVWGSWCGPCIKNLPKLKKLQNELTNVEFIGICKERSKADGVKAAKKAGIKWKNIFSSFDTSNLNILSYPTYIVLESNEVKGRFNKVEDVESFLMDKMMNSTANKR